MCMRVGEVGVLPYRKVFGATEKKILRVDIQIQCSDSTQLRRTLFVVAVVYRLEEIEAIEGRL